MQKPQKNADFFFIPVKFIAQYRFFLIFVKFEQTKTSVLKNSETGRRGEDLALAWLESHGLRLLDRNWRSGHKEIDLVMESAGRLHIVEVKTLTFPVLGRPGDRVDAFKQGRLVAAARHYAALHRVQKEIQFDVVSVILDGDCSQVEYIPEAFFPIARVF